jgi:hypothetical protein
MTDIVMAAEPYREIALTRGLFAIVDARDFEFLSQWKWHASQNGYAMRRESRRSTYRTISMHRQILGLEYGDTREVDHINRNGLDNRRCNLRIATSSENKMNHGMQSRNTSGYKGVTLDKQSQRWKAQIGVSGKTISIGKYKNPHDAYKAYCDAALRYHGEFVCLDKNEMGGV